MIVQRLAACNRAVRALAVVAAFCLHLSAAETVVAVDVSPPPILQWFEASHETMINRTPDLFMAGYGAVWTPPPYRADTSDLSVGYDVYDRFDLGRWDKKTLYGTETSTKRTATMFHRAGADFHVDFVMNHNGYSGTSSHADREAFKAAGGYPGFFLEFFGDVDGDFNSAYAYGDVQGRLAGLIDIDHSKDYRAVRNPVPGMANNIAPGTTSWAGRLANLPEESNRRFYPDIGHNTIYVYDPVTGESNIPIHQFNLDNPMAGDPVEENAMGYIMRNAQWLIQVIGADGLRIDAGKHMEGFVFDFLDRAVYRQNPRNLLDGSPNHVFSYTETFDANPAVLHPHVKKTINPGDIGTIGANRDTMDFKLYYALKENLESTAMSNAWQTIKDAALDVSPANGQGDTLHNGNAGVMFVNNHDLFRPNALHKVAHAYILMHPGNAVIYNNTEQFNQWRESDIWQRFPKFSHMEVEADPLGVDGIGSDLVRLAQVRNTHGRGDYAERWDGTDGLFAFERVSSAIVLLSNRADAGYDARTLTNVGFAPGTHLVELTGNATNDNVNPDRGGYRDVPEVVTVYDDGGVNKVNVRFQRPSTIMNDSSFNFHGNGYLVYGLPTPVAPAGLELIAGVDSVLAGSTTDRTTRQTDIYVVKADLLDVRLQTVPVNLLGSIRDEWADGDNAMLKLDGGRPVNQMNPYGTPSGVDFDTPGTATYGFEFFGNKSSPLVGPNGLGDPGWNGDGEFLQTIDVTQLEEGVHFLEARAFRHRTDGGPAVFSSFKKVIYVDRLPPNSAVYGFQAVDTGSPGDNDVLLESVDYTGDNMHVFMNLPAAFTDQQIYDYINSAQGGPDLSGYTAQTDRVDVNLFKTYRSGIPNGNNVFTLVTYEQTGTSNIQRITGITPQNVRGGGLGDLNHDYAFSSNDLAGVPGAFEEVLWSCNQQFNPAGDTNGDGLVNVFDLLDLGPILALAGADGATMTTWQEVKMRRVDFNSDGQADRDDYFLLVDHFGGNECLYDLDSDGTVGEGDRDMLVNDFGIVPEPSALFLLAVGGIVLAAHRRRSTIGVA